MLNAMRTAFEVSFDSLSYICPDDALARCQALGACVLFGPQSVMPLNGPTSGGYVVTLTGEYFGVSASGPGVQAKVGATSCMVSRLRACVVLKGQSAQDDFLFDFCRECAGFCRSACARTIAHSSDIPGAGVDVKNIDFVQSASRCRNTARVRGCRHDG